MQPQSRLDTTPDGVPSALPLSGAPARRLRVLMIAASFPFPPASGVDMRNSQIARQMSRFHDVTLLTYQFARETAGDLELPAGMDVRSVPRSLQRGPSKRVAQLRSLLSPLPFAARFLLSDEMQAAIDGLIAERSFDLIHLESSTMSCFRLPPDVPVVLDEHNIEYELFGRLFRGERGVARRLFNGVEYLRTRRFERACWKQVAACAVTSEREEPVVRAVAPGIHAAVVPNGVDLDYFAPVETPSTPRTAVFTGVLNYRPNIDGALFLAHEVWPLVQQAFPDATVTLVGSATEREAARIRRPGVVVTGHVPDVRPYLRDASVVTVPVRMGGGTRLKLVEALSLGKAVASTTLGCEGIAVRDGEHLLIGDDAETFAARIVELFGDDQLRTRLGTAGRRLMESRYSWDFAGARMNELYWKAVGAGGESTVSGRVAG